MRPVSLLLMTVVAAAGCEASVQTQPTYARYEPAPPPSGHVSPEWVQLADRYSAETPSQQILLRGRGEFRAIRVEAARGAPLIKKVTIDYEDGTPQVVNLEARLAPGEGKTIDLNGGRREVKRVIVYSEPGFGGAYNLFGA
jgi:hypothetical protein